MWFKVWKRVKGEPVLVSATMVAITYLFSEYGVELTSNQQSILLMVVTGVVAWLTRNVVMPVIRIKDAADRQNGALQALAKWVEFEQRLPHLELDGRGHWSLGSDWMGVLAGHSITIPEGFEFDLASIPRPLWSFMAPFELSSVAPLVHDAIYKYKGDVPVEWVEPARRFSRLEADMFFRLLMKQEGVPVFRRTAAYIAVRLFGIIPWMRKAA